MLKSAFEIAMEKTKNIEGDEKKYSILTKEQRERIEKINKEYDIKIAELEIKFSSRLKELREKCGEEEFQEHLASFYGEFEMEKNKINGERREKISQIKGK